MDKTIVPDFSTTKPAPRPLFWLATRAFLLHSLVTVIALAWCVLVNQPGLGLMLVFLWIVAFTIWLEWRGAK